ncbi:MAG: acetyl/propionyl-CoA carboxylase alpha subunit [Cognaticolwellia sp.]|jgi:acetyl/propionyl-CoA carboxylase alpha subunit
MHYDVTLDGKTRRIEIERVGEDHVRVVVDSGEAIVVERRSLSGGMSLVIDGRSYDAGLVQRDAGWDVSLLGVQHPVEVLDPRKKALRLAGGPGEGKLKSSMPGRVVSILVEEGYVVEKGQAIIIIEAMKMENEVKAPVAGLVSGIQVTPGQAVDAGAPLLTITALEEE